MQAAGLQLWQMFEGNSPDYPRTRQWALHVWETLPKVQGLHWRSRRDNAHAVVMLFGDRVPASEVMALAAPVQVAAYEDKVLAIVQRLRCSVLL